jgi:hypothetical protein
MQSNQPSDRPSTSARKPLVVVPRKRPLSSPKRPFNDPAFVPSVAIARFEGEAVVIAPNLSAIETWFHENCLGFVPTGVGVKVQAFYQNESRKLIKYVVFNCTTLD